MTALEKEVRRAQRRLFLQSLSAKLAWCWFAALLVAACAITAGRFYPALDQQAWAIGWLVGATAAGLLAAAAWSLVRPASLSTAAVEIDRRLALKERVASTLALSPGERESAIGQALAADAHDRLRRVNVADAFRLRPDRKALLPLVAAGLAFAAATLVPVRVPPTVAKTQAERVQAKKATQALAKKLDERRKQDAAKGLDEAESIAKLEQGIQELSESGDKDHKQTLLALNDLVKDAQARREQLAGSEDLKKQLSVLKQLDQGPADELGKALKNGDFNKALEAINKLGEDLKADKLPPEARQALAKQLDQLKEALQQKAEAHERLARELADQRDARRQAGDEAQCQKLQQQLDKLAEQRPQMEQLAAMAQQLEQAADAMESGEGQQAAEALSALGEQLAGMEENLQEMEALDGALEQVADAKRAMACKDCNGQGCEACQGGDWDLRDGHLNDRLTQRGGGKGIGVGRGPGMGPETDPEGNFYDSSVKQQPGKGSAKVVGEAPGPNRKGQVREEIQAEIAGGEQNAADALSEQRLPHDYRDHAQKYFDALREGKR